MSPNRDGNQNLDLQIFMLSSGTVFLSDVICGQDVGSNHVQGGFCVALLVRPNLGCQAPGQRDRVTVIERHQGSTGLRREGDDVDDNRVAVTSRRPDFCHHKFAGILTLPHLRLTDELAGYESIYHVVFLCPVVRKWSRDDGKHMREAPCRCDAAR